MRGWWAWGPRKRLGSSGAEEGWEPEAPDASRSRRQWASHILLPIAPQYPGRVSDSFIRRGMAAE